MPILSPNFTPGIKVFSFPWCINLCILFDSSIPVDLSVMGMSMTNSSPPKRARISDSRTDD